MRYLVFILLFSFALTSCETEQKKQPKKAEIKTPKIGELILSKIDQQEVIFGSYINTFFAIPNPSRTRITFDKIKEPACMQAFLQTKGISNLILAPTEITDNQLVTEIKATSPYGENTISFQTKVVQPKGKIFYAAPEKSKNLGKTINGHLLENLQSVLTKVQKSNTHTTIFLTSGNYFFLPLLNAQNITIVPALEATPHFNAISIENSSNCTLQGLTIGAENPKGKNSYYIKVDAKSSNITIKNCLIQAANITESWEPIDWKEKASNGIFSEASNCHFHHNLIRNIHHGLETKGHNNLVNNNVIIRFAGDAIRNTGDQNIFASNYMADALVDDYSAKDGNHDDLFQCWTFDKPIKNIIVRDNIAINCTDTTIHLQSKNVQGIACFDGFEENWLIENNLVILEHPHGIALFGANQCQVKDNRIIPSPFNTYTFESQPWIMINNHKDGRPSHNNLIINNLVSVLKISDSIATITNNQIIDSNPAKTFSNYENWIFTLK